MKRYRVTFENIGEGYSGDYNENDPTDQPLLRFSCEKKVGRSWEWMEDASYCTCLPETTDKKKLERYSKRIVKCLEDTDAKGESYRHELERFSWLGNGVNEP
jgi:hypothetical protein